MSPGDTCGKECDLETGDAQSGLYRQAIALETCHVDGTICCRLLALGAENHVFGGGVRLWCSWFPFRHPQPPSSLPFSWFEVLLLLLSFLVAASTLYLLKLLVLELPSPLLIDSTRRYLLLFLF